MKIILKIIRNSLGGIIAFISWIIPSQQVERSLNEQIIVDEQTKNLKLYQFFACPFCIKTRRAIRRLNLKIETRNAQNGQFRDELLSGGGEIKVPCLRIDCVDNTSWMYESDKIIAYLEKKFDK